MKANCAIRGRGGFTLIEIMVVVAIIGLTFGALVPTLFIASRKESFRAAVSDIVEVCENARRRAILKGAVTEVYIYPKERRISIGASSGEEGNGTTSAVWSERVGTEMVDVNLVEYRDAELARVRFYPNGTSDEMTIILRSEKNEFKKISLEPMTALASADELLR